MTTKHTPGPWEIDGEYVQQAGQAGLAVCDVMNMDVGGAKGWYSGPVTQANKDLIAAAPELLEALEAEEEWRAREEAGALDPEWDYDTMVASKRRAAIAKAKGEQQ